MNGTRNIGVVIPAVFLTTVLGSVVFLILGVWPGLIGGTIFSFPFVLLSLPAFGIWSLLLAGLGIIDLYGGMEETNRRRWGMWSGGVMFATLILLWFHVPQRFALGFCSTELESLAAEAPMKRLFERDVEITVGPYQVDAYAGDERGGVFFRTHTGPDGIGPDQMSYGFVFRPNRKGTPFGNAHYQLSNLFSDWYVFAVSDDW